ncbi:MAG: nucleotide exchange factor GrpE [archaeon]
MGLFEEKAKPTEVNAPTSQNEEKVNFAQKNNPLANPQNQEEMKIKELTETLQRLQAEFENYQKRNAKQNEDYKVLANAKLIEELLPVLDSLEVGMKHSRDLVIVHEQLIGILKKNGVAKIKAEKGNAFDHDKMECLMQETNPSLKDGVVASILMDGYLLNGKILRLAKVSVNNLDTKNCAPEKNENENKIPGANESLTKEKNFQV